jgi:hypothetical protein
MLRAQCCFDSVARRVFAARIVPGSADPEDRRPVAVANDDAADGDRFAFDVVGEGDGLTHGCASFS